MIKKLFIFSFSSLLLENFKADIFLLSKNSFVINWNKSEIFGLSSFLVKNKIIGCWALICVNPWKYLKANIESSFNKLSIQI